MMRFIEYTNKTMNEVYESLKNAWIQIREQWEDKNFEQRSGVGCTALASVKECIGHIIMHLVRLRG